MLTAIKHTVSPLGSKKARLWCVVALTALLLSLFSVTANAFSIADCSDKSAKQTEQLQVSSGELLVAQHPGTGLPIGNLPDEDTLLTESFEDDEFSTAAAFLIENNGTHNILEGQLLRLPGSLQKRPMISLVILHHSWKIYLS